MADRMDMIDGVVVSREKEVITSQEYSNLMISLMGFDRCTRCGVSLQPSQVRLTSDAEALCDKCAEDDRCGEFERKE